MIMRTWRGATAKDDADSYIEYMRQTGLPGYLETDGNRGALLLRRDRDERTEFVFLSMWDSMDAVRRFAGAEYESAVFYAKDDAFLIERDDRVDHYEVVLDTSEPDADD